MDEEKFGLRLAKLRGEKNVSARDMSLSIGQNPGYINSIENGKSLPSMSVFFFICEYLGVAPKDFFDTESDSPARVRRICESLNKLKENELSAVEQIILCLLANN